MDIYRKKPLSYRRVTDPDELMATVGDPVMLPAGVVVVMCIETNRVDQPICYSEEEFHARYEVVS